MEAAREKLAKEKGASALEPWNLSHALSGDVEKCVRLPVIASLAASPCSRIPDVRA